MQKSTNRDGNIFFNLRGIKQFGGGIEGGIEGGIGGVIGDSVGGGIRGGIGCGFRGGIEGGWYGKGGVMYPSGSEGIDHDAGFEGYEDGRRFGEDGVAFRGDGGRIGPNKDEMYNGGNKFGIFNPQMIEYERRKYMNETDIYPLIHNVYSLKESKINLFFIKYLYINYYFKKIANFKVIF